MIFKNTHLLFLKNLQQGSNYQSIEFYRQNTERVCIKGKLLYIQLNKVFKRL